MSVSNDFLRKELDAFVKDGGIMFLIEIVFILAFNYASVLPVHGVEPVNIS